jgi:hypothetical protein
MHVSPDVHVVLSGQLGTHAPFLQMVPDPQQTPLHDWLGEQHVPSTHTFPAGHWLSVEHESEQAPPLQKGFVLSLAKHWASDAHESEQAPLLQKGFVLSLAKHWLSDAHESEQAPPLQKGFVLSLAKHWASDAHEVAHAPLTQVCPVGQHKQIDLSGLSALHPHSWLFEQHAPPPMHDSPPGHGELVPHSFMHKPLKQLHPPLLGQLCQYPSKYPQFWVHAPFMHVSPDEHCEVSLQVCWHAPFMHVSPD